MKKRLVLGTAGHIDHGKSSLVRALTGVDPDRLPEEKRRGMTIDLGFADLDLPDFRLGIVDVPGHERFIKNMLAGAAAIDMALLVVAADDSVMPQTREHLAILDLLRISVGVVAITKCDLREQDWLQLVREEVAELIADTRLEGAPIVMTSAAARGEPTGIDQLRAALNEAGARVQISDAEDVFRLCVDRVFTATGRGTVITGSVSTGEVAEGAIVEHLPQQRQLAIRGLQSHGSAVESVGRGTRAAINLAGVHHTEMSRGDVIASPGYFKPTTLLSVELNVLDSSAWSVKHRGRYTLHLGSQATPARVYLFEGAALAPGKKGIAQLHIADPVVAVYDQPLVLRNESPVATVGGGRVLQPCARIVRRGRLDDVQRLHALAAADGKQRVDLALRAIGATGWTCADLRRDAGVGRQEAETLTAQLEADGRLVRLTTGDVLHADVVAGLERRALAAIEALHAARPLSLHLPKAHIAEQIGRQITDGILDAVLQRLIDSGIAQGDLQRLRLASFQPQLTEKQERERNELIASLRNGGMQPPMAPELAKQLQCENSVVSHLLQLLVEQEEAVFIGPNLFLDAGCAARLRQTVRKALQEHGTMTVAEIRDLLGVSRKYAVPICEYLDRSRLTQRDGDERRLHAQADGVASHDDS